MMEQGPEGQGLPILLQEDIWFPQSKAREHMDADGETRTASDVKPSKDSRRLCRAPWLLGRKLNGRSSSGFLSSKCMIFLGSVHLVLRTTCVRVGRGEQGAPPSPTLQPAAAPSPGRALSDKDRNSFQTRCSKHFLHSSSLHRPAPVRTHLSHPSRLGMPGTFLGVKCPGAPSS